MNKTFTLTNPGGQPISFNISMSSIVAPGSLSDGLITDAFPVIMAIGNIQRGIMAGKLKGQMPAVTPKGFL